MSVWHDSIVLGRTHSRRDSTSQLVIITGGATVDPSDLNSVYACLVWFVGSAEPLTRPILMSELLLGLW